MRDLWVVKVGSSLVKEGGPLLIQSWINQVDLLNREKNLDIIWVSSGAIALGEQKKNQFRASFAEPFSEGERSNGKGNWSLSEKQSLSAIGQPYLMDWYRQAGLQKGRLTAQILVTTEDLQDEMRKTNILQTIKTHLSWRVIPIVNENDTVATEEIQFGDNDQLASDIAVELRANRLVLLSHVGGLLKNPGRKDASIIFHKESVNEADVLSARHFDGHRENRLGAGGMESKLRAVQKMLRWGIPTTICQGANAELLGELANGKSVGTCFGPLPTPAFLSDSI